MLDTGLLDDADHHVEGDDGYRDDGVERAVEQDQDTTECEEDEVDQGHDVLAQDLCVGATGREPNIVALTPGPAQTHLIF